jgi:Protein of unknown function (DUF1573)
MKSVTLLVLTFVAFGSFAQTKPKTTKKTKPVATTTPVVAPTKPTSTTSPGTTTTVPVATPSTGTMATDMPVKPVPSTLVFKSTKIERLEIPYDSKEPFVFEFKNTGKEPVLVTNVQTSCGCTAAEKPTEPVAGGAQSKIVVTYDTKRVGNFTKTITVTTNVGDPVILTITGTVMPAPIVDPQAPVNNQETH